MQLLHQCGLGALTLNPAVTGNAIIVSAAANVRGVIIKSVFFTWYHTAVNASVDLLVFNNGGINIAFYAFDSNGAAGIINIPKVVFSEKEVFLPPGSDVVFGANINNARATGGIQFRTL